ncbi:hypothetical protein PF001_g27123 [Phytophthora fragariae]|nr:hypothetical protein PF009_g28831 [Phytophthora fragariae]KAE8970349.1 hypothetical protein PF011_g26457 [Phytophthora fragariae]KAE9089924.1 hypothetical protein PF006_g25259 [Phytophthora fragariae]KAE9274291.1 hypothetical protein PF001_g27123 [Phytophthora fragariae]KAE9284397.1 hypothetical protein PF008_g27168 [Phytophthora fragariae]
MFSVALGPSLRCNFFPLAGSDDLDNRRLDVDHETKTSLRVLDVSPQYFTFLLIHVLLLLDAFTLGHLGLEDKVILDVKILGRSSKFLVIPDYASRVFTVVVWSGRFVYVVLTRQDDNALILLRGEMEFDYQKWKKQAKLDQR